MIDDLVQLTCTCKIIFSTLISLFFCFGVNFTTKPDQARSLKLCFISLFVKVIGSIRFYYLIARVVYYLKQKESKPKKIIWRQLCNLGRTKEICSQEYKIDFSRLLRNFFWKTKLKNQNLFPIWVWISFQCGLVYPLFKFFEVELAFYNIKYLLRG